MMASSRKKQDEKNLKTLRELGALPQNKYCFDCHQRGPTYVDVTIGSFVCTKCSGMLRGVTPPHRVKSISMATFTTEEIELLRNRGNDYCKQVWLGLYDESARPFDSSDEQTIRDFMVDKYERKRYYLDPGQAMRNGHNNTRSSEPPRFNKPSDPKPIKLNGNTTNAIITTTTTETNRKRPEVKNSVGFAVNFDNADIFSSTNNNSSMMGGKQHQQQHHQQQQQQHTTNNVQQSFANFDDNPVFNNSNMSMPTPPTFDKLNMVQQPQHTIKVPAPPPEDKYAALKDLDNALKSQNSVDWNSSGSNGSLYSSPTPSGSVYSSSSPQSSMFGSPSQGQFMNVFQTNQDNNGFSNPFSNGNNGLNGLSWATNGNNNMGTTAPSIANPFRDPVKMNGFAPNFQQTVFPVMNGTPWGANPFKVPAANANSNNPFL